MTAMFSAATLANAMSTPFIKPLPGGVTITKPGSNWTLVNDLGHLTVADGVGNVSVSVLGDVEHLTLKRFSDGFSGYFEGDVDDVNVFDVWAADLTITGNVDSLSMEYVNDFAVSVWGGVENANFDGFWNSAAYFGDLEEGSVNNATNSSLTIGFFEKLEIEGAFGLDVTVYNGHGAEIDIESSVDGSIHGYSMEGAAVNIWDSEGTQVKMEFGDVTYNDHGSNTSIIDGDGDSFVFLSGDGEVMVNGGEGNDTFVVQHEGSAILAGGSGADSFHFFAPGETNAVILDWNPQEGDTGSIAFGNGSTGADLGTFMAVFGEENSDGSLTALIGQGSITTYPIADEFLFG